jgi:DNA-binding response OmpR family regulator
MTVIILDENKHRTAQLNDLLQKKQCKVLSVHTSNDFLGLISSEKVDKVLLDSVTFAKGRSIFRYLNIGKKLANIPVISYNSSNALVGLEGREAHVRDRMLGDTADPAQIIAALEQEA